MSDTALEPSPAPSSAIVTAEIDQQISTARRYPRDLGQVLKNSIANATLTREIAESMAYAKPIGGGKFAEGPSVRLAEVIAAEFGNIQAASYTVEIGQRTVTARGSAWNLQNNYRVGVTCTKSIMTSAKKGRKPRRFSDSQIAVVCGAAESIAWRNAVIRCVGRALVNQVLDAARSKAVGPDNQLAARTKKMLDRLMDAYSVHPDRACAAVGVEITADIGKDELAQLLALGTAINDNETTIEEAFPMIGKVVKKQSKAPASADDLDFDAATGEIVE